MPKLLLNANLSPETATNLRNLGFDVFCLLEESLSSISDEEGVVVLRLKNQTVEAVNAVLGRFFEDFKGKETQLQNSLVVVEEDRYRFYSAEK